MEDNGYYKDILVWMNDWIMGTKFDVICRSFAIYILNPVGVGSFDIMHQENLNFNKGII